MDERVWIDVGAAQPEPGQRAQIAWFANGRLEQTTPNVLWLGHRWDGWYTPTHWRPADSASDRE